MILLSNAIHCVKHLSAPELCGGAADKLCMQTFNVLHESSVGYFYENFNGISSCVGVRVCVGVWRKRWLAFKIMFT